MDTRRKVGVAILIVFAVAVFLVLANNYDYTSQSATVINSYYPTYTSPSGTIVPGFNYSEMCSNNFPTYYGGLGSNACGANYGQNVSYPYYQYYYPGYYYGSNYNYSY